MNHATRLFTKNFFLHPLQNASIVPSSRFASAAMIDGIDFSKIDSIVELGSGTGVFAEEILKRCKPGTKVILVEIEPTYVENLKQKFGESVIVENKSAHLLEDILKEHGIERVDLIVSGLPFLPTSMKKELITSLQKLTKQGSIFRFFTYSLPAMKLMYKDLPVRRISFVLRNFPPMWVYGIN